jgi:NAD(P)-dependent dehydrogenase (short-subunit alcohol dehydrogenase family)
MKLDGKVAVVTGGASGIGRATAEALARRGARAVVVADVDLELGQEAAVALKALGTEARFIATDVSDPTQLRAMLEEVASSSGGLDILHNNAGLVSGNPPWPATSVERIQQVVGVNVLGVFAGTRIGLDLIDRGGTIINTASVAGLAPMPPDAVYAATKAAIISFTQSCAALHESTGIRVNAVLPGIVDTPMIAKTGDGLNAAEWLVPLLEVGEIALKPEHIAASVVGLIEDDSRNGEVLVVAEP